ncbi:MAG: hypothetical protein RLZZ618_1336 [Pseudomonadota bacterium]|jgi:hypothetical protein
MTVINSTGLPALLGFLAFVALLSAPVWLAARMVHADRPTLLFSALSLLSGLVGSVVAGMVAGSAAVFLVPLAFLLSFKYVLGTSFVGAIALSILALAGYAALAHLPPNS